MVIQKSRCFIHHVITTDLISIVVKTLKHTRLYLSQSETSCNTLSVKRMTLPIVHQSS